MGPLGSDTNRGEIDSGTLALTRNRPPGPLGASGEQERLAHRPESIGGFPDSPKSFAESAAAAAKAQGFVLRDAFYRPELDTPELLEIFKIDGAGGLHEKITRAAAMVARVRYDRALNMGIAWNDVPCEDPNVVNTCYVMTGKNISKEGTLANRSHHGDLQFWHSMSPGVGYTNGEVRDLVLKQAANWYGTAIKERSLFNIGKLLHMVQDSYSASHVARSGGMILYFQDYNLQDADKHGEADKPTGNRGDWRKDPGVREAVKVSATILEMYRDKAPTSALVDYLKTSVYVFAPGAELRAAGGTLPAYRHPRSAVGRIIKK